MGVPADQGRLRRLGRPQGRASNHRLPSAEDRQPSQEGCSFVKRERSGPMRYVYLGARGTDPKLVGRACDPVRQADGKVVRGRGSAYVIFEGEELPRAVVARRLRVVDRS
jgi:hypothetical protein